MATRGLVVAHGDVARALVSAVEGFLGPQDDLDALSNDGLSAVGLSDAIERVRIAARDPLFVFSDMPGGSCATAADRTAATNADVVSIHGVNVPMIVEFCHYRTRLAPGELADRVVAKGRRAVSSSRESA